MPVLDNGGQICKGFDDMGSIILMLCYLLELYPLSLHKEATIFMKLLVACATR